MAVLQPYPRKFTVAFAAIALLLFVVEHINGRFWLNDLRVYYGAGEALLKGDPLYGVAHGLDTGIFKYAPLLAVVYAVLALLPYTIAASIQYLLITLAFLDGMRRIDRLVREQLMHGKAASYPPLLLGALVGVVHLHRELHLGNINMMLLWLLVVSLERLVRGEDRLGGALAGMAMLAKPHFVVLIPLLLLRRRWHALGAAVGAVLVGLLLPALFLGWQANLQVHAQWLGEMAQHNAALIYTGGDDYRAVNTVYSFLHRALLQHFIPIATGLEAYVVLAIIVAAFGLFVLQNLRRGTRTAFPFEFLLLVALVPSITLTDTEHFLLALPMVVYSVHRLVPKADPPGLAWLAVPALLLYGGNWADALGPLSAIMVHYGALGIGNMWIIGLGVWCWMRSNRAGPSVSNQAR